MAITRSSSNLSSMQANDRKRGKPEEDDDDEEGVRDATDGSQSQGAAGKGRKRRKVKQEPADADTSLGASSGAGPSSAPSTPTLTATTSTSTSPRSPAGGRRSRRRQARRVVPRQANQLRPTGLAIQQEEQHDKESAVEVEVAMEPQDKAEEEDEKATTAGQTGMSNATLELGPPSDDVETEVQEDAVASTSQDAAEDMPAVMAEESTSMSADEDENEEVEQKGKAAKKSPRRRLTAPKRRLTAKEKGKSRARRDPTPPPASTANTEHVPAHPQGGQGDATPQEELAKLRKELENAHATLESQTETLQAVNAAFTCNVCLETLQNPLALACGHVFCQDDLWNWFHRVNDDSDPDEPPRSDNGEEDDVESISDGVANSDMDSEGVNSEDGMPLVRSQGAVRSGQPGRLARLRQDVTRLRGELHNADRHLVSHQAASRRRREAARRNLIFPVSDDDSEDNTDDETRLRVLRGSINRLRTELRATQENILAERQTRRRIMQARESGRGGFWTCSDDYSTDDDEDHEARQVVADQGERPPRRHRPREGRDRAPATTAAPAITTGSNNNRDIGSAGLDARLRRLNTVRQSADNAGTSGRTVAQAIEVATSDDDLIVLPPTGPSGTAGGASRPARTAAAAAADATTLRARGESSAGRQAAAGPGPLTLRSRGLRPELPTAGARRSDPFRPHQARPPPPHVFREMDEADQLQAQLDGHGAPRNPAEGDATAPDAAPASTEASPEGPRVAPRKYPNKHNLVCPQCRTKVNMPPFPMFVIRDLNQLLRAYNGGRRQASLERDDSSNSIGDATWGGIFPQAAGSTQPRASENVNEVAQPEGLPEAPVLPRTGSERRQDRQALQVMVRTRERELRRLETQRDQDHRDSRASRGGRRSLQQRQALSRAAASSGAIEQARRLLEDARREAGIAGAGGRSRTGRDVVRRGIRDHEDGVRRCVECGWEIENARCEQCDIDYDSDSEFDDNADDVRMVTSSAPPAQAEASTSQPDDTQNDEDEPDLSDLVVITDEDDAKPKAKDDDSFEEDEANPDEEDSTTLRRRTTRRNPRRNGTRVVSSSDNSSIKQQSDDEEEEDEGEDLFDNEGESAAPRTDRVSGDSEEDEEEETEEAKKAAHDRLAARRKRKRNQFVYDSSSSPDPGPSAVKREKYEDDEEEDDFINDADPGRVTSSELEGSAGTESEAELTDADTRRVRREQARASRAAAGPGTVALGKRRRLSDSDSDFKSGEESGTSEDSEQVDDGDDEHEGASSDESEDGDALPRSAETSQTTPPDVKEEDEDEESDGPIDEICSKSYLRTLREDRAAERAGSRSAAGNAAGRAAMTREQQQQQQERLRAANAVIDNAFYSIVLDRMKRAEAEAGSSSGRRSIAAGPSGAAAARTEGRRQDAGASGSGSGRTKRAIVIKESDSE